MISKYMQNLKTTENGLSTYGILIFAITMLAFPIVDSLAKLLMHYNFQVLQIAAARFFFQAVLAFSLLLYYKQNIIRVFSTNIKPKLLMSLSAIGLTLGFYIALKNTSISIALSVLFMAPLFTLLLSGFILKERITKPHIIACIAGFIGTIFIIRPGTESFNTGALYALIAAVSWSSMNIISRIYGGKLDAKETQCFTGVISTIVYGLAFVAIEPQSSLLPTMSTFWVITFISGTVSGLLYIMIQIAHSYTKASTLAPVQYLEIISGLTLDLVLFNLVPDMYSWIGINIIIMSGLVMWQINRKNKKQS